MNDPGDRLERKADAMVADAADVLHALVHNDLERARNRFMAIMDRIETVGEACVTGMMFARAAAVGAGFDPGQRMVTWVETRASGEPSALHPAVLDVGPAFLAAVQNQDDDGAAYLFRGLDTESQVMLCWTLADMAAALLAGKLGDANQN
jgi:hypothetical protein